MDFSIEDLVNSLTLRNKILLHHLMIRKHAKIDLIFDLFLPAFFGHGRFWHAVLHSGVLFWGCTQQLSFHYLLSLA
jgi:hypothetical protein